MTETRVMLLVAIAWILGIISGFSLALLTIR